MSVGERVGELAAKLSQQKSAIETEEATKNAFVMPFIGRVLGYDVFNPAEVIPEFTADVGTKKGEKIDYALVRDGEVQILVEAKKITEPLRHDAAYSQLWRYFSVTKARVAALTNGQVWEFYTDLDEPNKMDEKPYLVLDLSNVDPTLIPELTKLTRESFDLDAVLSAAGELKYVGQIKRTLAAEFKQPSDEWVRFLAGRVHGGKNFTQKVRGQFLPIVEKAAQQFLHDQVNDRLKTALGSDEAVPGQKDAVQNHGGGPPPVAAFADPVEITAPDTSEIVTTEEELEGFRIVRAIVCSEVAPIRITYRDSKTYFGILLDDNNRRTVARLWFNRSKKKYIGLFDENKNETRMPVDEVEDIYAYADQLRATVVAYLAKSAEKA